MVNGYKKVSAALLCGCLALAGCTGVPRVVRPYGASYRGPAAPIVKRSPQPPRATVPVNARPSPDETGLTPEQKEQVFKTFEQQRSVE